MKNIVIKLVVTIWVIVAISGMGFAQNYVDNAEMQKLSSSITEGTWFALNETNGNTATVGYSLTSFVYAGTTVSAWNSALLVSSIDGTPLFAQQLVATPTNMLNPTSVGFDDSGAIYLAVEFQDDIIINGITYSPMGNSEMAVIKYSSTGTYQSHVLIQSSDAVIFLDFEVTANGNIHMAGAFEGILYVNGVSTGIVSLGGSTNALVLVVNSAGQFVSGHEIGTSSGSQNWCKAFTIEVDSTGADIVGGEFKGANCSFGGSYTITPAGYDDYFVAKYDGSTCQGVLNRLWECRRRCVSYCIGREHGICKLPGSTECGFPSVERKRLSWSHYFNRGRKSRQRNFVLVRFFHGNMCFVGSTYFFIFRHRS